MHSKFLAEEWPCRYVRFFHCASHFCGLSIQDATFLPMQQFNFYAVLHRKEEKAELVHFLGGSVSLALVFFSLLARDDSF